MPAALCPACQAACDEGTNFCDRCGSDLRSSDRLVGRLIDGRYRVLEPIGRGASGMVYKVEHQRMGKIAAMKVLHGDLASDKEVVRRFRREVEAVSKLTDPHTVQTFDFGTSDGALYLVMEYVRGDDLGAIVARDGPLPCERALPIFTQVCGALAEAHSLGIIHRDLKPENIIVTRTKDGHEHAKVLDFGLAKLSERDDAADSTGQGNLVGTPHYMSPEQINGDPLDARSDIYALGATMFRVLAGKPPFQAQTQIGVLTKHLTDEPPPLPASVPASVAAVVRRALAKEPDDRFASVQALNEELERVREGLRAPAAAPRAELSHTGSGEARLHREDFDAFERSLRRRTLVRAIGVPLVLGVAVVGVVAYLRWQKRQPHAAEVEPDNDLASATLIGAGRPVSGQIRERLADDQGDLDYFRVPTGAREGTPAIVRARLSAIRNMDLVVAIYDPRGKLLAVGDNLGVGEAEVIPNLAVTVPEVVAAVLERRVPGRAPMENPTDSYELTVEVGPVVAGEEHEPDDAPDEAAPLRPGDRVRGWLGKIKDVDRFRFDGPAGAYELKVTGAPSVGVLMGFGRSAPKPARLLRLNLAPGDLLAVERAEEDPEAGRPVAHGIDEPYTLTIGPIR